MKYPAPTINSLVDGAKLDMRFKLAQQLLLAPGFLHNVKPLIDTGAATVIGSGPVTPDVAAQLAVLTADALFRQAESLGWIAPLDDSGEPLPPGELRAIERGTEANAHGQMHAQKVMQAIQEQSLRLARPGFGGINQ